MKLLIQAAAISIALAGCAGGQVWTKPNLTQPAFETDKYNCESDAYQYAADSGTPGNPFVAAPRFRKCMAAKGYSLVAAP